MPFTISHAAAVIPFKRISKNPLPLSALVIGSFSPDFKYFFPLTRLSIFSHTLSGVFLFCLPVSLLALGIFHAVVKEPLLYLLPGRIQKRLVANSTKFSFTPLNKFAVLIIAVILGALTHIIWDSFTHEHGRVVESWAVLNTTLFKVRSYEVKLFALLQHLSTIIGLGLLAYWFRQWFGSVAVQTISERQGFSSRLKIMIWLILIGLTLIFGVSFGGVMASRFGGIRSIQVFVAQTVVGWMLGGVIFILLYSLICKWAGINYFSGQNQTRQPDGN